MEQPPDPGQPEPPAQPPATTPEAQPPAVPSSGGPPAPLGEASQELAEAERRLKSEDMVIASPFSYAGTAERIWKLTRRDVAQNPWAKVGLVTVAVLLIALAWVLVTGWYVIWGLLLVPYRLIRRGQRKRKLEAARHRELLEGMESRKD